MALGLTFINKASPEFIRCLKAFPLDILKFINPSELTIDRGIYRVDEYQNPSLLTVREEWEPYFREMSLRDLLCVASSLTQEKIDFLGIDNIKTFLAKKHTGLSSPESLIFRLKKIDINVMREIGQENFIVLLNQANERGQDMKARILIRIGGISLSAFKALGNLSEIEEELRKHDSLSTAYYPTTNGPMH